MSAPSLPLAPYPWWDVIFILLLVILNGLLAMSELAVVSSRRSRLKAMAKSGVRGAQTALDLAADPGRFLSTVQSGITLIAVLSGAFSGASLGAPTGDRIALLGVPHETAQNLGFALVIILTTYASLVIGELVPKQIALRSPEPIAVVVAKPMRWLARLMAPFVWLLDRSSSMVFRLIRLNRESEDHVTAEELQLVVAEAATAGVLEESERALISSVVRLADRPIREVMTPRTEVAWIDADADDETIRRKLIEAPHNRIPVAEGSVDRLIGVVQARDIVSCLLTGPAFARTRSSIAVTGIVVDESGGAIAGARITASSANGALIQTTTSDAAGGFELRDLAPGAYTVLVEMNLFAAVAQTVTVPASGSAGPLRVVLKAGGFSESVVVIS